MSATFLILAPGVQTSVQDFGRAGYRHLGVAEGGALDRFALARANALVGNPENAAALEIGFGPFALRFEHEGWLALTGADFDAQLDEQPLWRNWRFPFRAGQCLRLSGPRYGMRAYLAVSGGIEVPEVMGARATDLGAGFGGFQGRALRKGDRLAVGVAQHLPTHRIGLRAPTWSAAVRALPGPEFAALAAPTAFWERHWTVDHASNRIGTRLTGEALALKTPLEMPSHGVFPGIVQLPPAGTPIVLLADAQATGGYPRIACVIAADLWKLAQARPGMKIHFEPTTPEAARAALRTQREDYAYSLERLYA